MNAIHARQKTPTPRSTNLTWTAELTLALQHANNALQALQVSTHADGIRYAIDVLHNALPNPMTSPTEFGDCLRSKWYGVDGKFLRTEGWRLRSSGPKWNLTHALIEREPLRGVPPRKKRSLEWRYSRCLSALREIGRIQAGVIASPHVRVARLALADCLASEADSVSDDGKGHTAPGK